MKENLLQIINHYGIKSQQRKLQEEVFELQQGIMYLANADDREINFTKSRVPQVVDILYKKCYLNKNNEVIKVEYLNK